MTATRHRAVICLASVLLAFGCEEKKSGSANTAASGSSAPQKLAVSSYDPTRELYQELNPAFAKWYKQTAGKDVTAETDHGPSGKQGRDIAAGKETDVAALSVSITSG